MQQRGKRPGKWTILVTLFVGVVVFPTILRYAKGQDDLRMWASIVGSVLAYTLMAGLILWLYRPGR